MFQKFAVAGFGALGLLLSLACYDPFAEEGTDTGWSVEPGTGDTGTCSDVWTCAYDGQATPMCQWACAHTGSERAETCAVLASMLESGDPTACCTSCR